MIAASEVHEQLTRIHDFLDRALSKWIFNAVCILAYLLNSTSRQHHEVRASQFPFHYSIKDSSSS